MTATDHMPKLLEKQLAKHGASTDAKNIVRYPLAMCLSESNISDIIGAKLLYPHFPEGANLLIGHKVYDCNEYHHALTGKGIETCIPLRKRCKNLAAYAAYCRRRYKQSNRS
ncbi:hypothetical protein [Flexibacterium corallicola]|uniref:hypothetical protein n=1 Tax=Flexibacterium corallicola TaxID=3037259 RepID=UPI00286F43A7|nr:hypothetical protein [Pseudovibrio sp. M1P-2-3]